MKPMRRSPGWSKVLIDAISSFSKITCARVRTRPTNTNKATNTTINSHLLASVDERKLDLRRQQQRAGVLAHPLGDGLQRHVGAALEPHELALSEGLSQDDNMASGIVPSSSPA